MSGWAVAHLEEIDELDDGRCPFRPVRLHLGIASFGITAWTGRSQGDRIINEHGEDDGEDSSEELYLVTAGRAVFELDGERRDAPAGTFVAVQPGVKRTAFAEEAGTTVVAIGGVPGRAYDAVGWELWAPVRLLYDAGDYAAAADRGRELIEASPQYPLPLYNLACVEALSGRTEDALEHLRRSIELSERFREYAKTDSDFDPVRDDPAFRQLVGDGPDPGAG